VCGVLSLFLAMMTAAATTAASDDVQQWIADAFDAFNLGNNYHRMYCAITLAADQVASLTEKDTLPRFAKTSEYRGVTGIERELRTDSQQQDVSTSASQPNAASFPRRLVTAREVNEWLHFARARRAGANARQGSDRVGDLEWKAPPRSEEVPAQHAAHSFSSHAD
jgi:hypothetical protein